MAIYVPNIVAHGAYVYIRELSQIGHRIAQRANLQKQTKRITGNQECAYGWAVYYKGKLQNYGVPRVWPAEQPRYRNGKAYWGREQLEEFLDTYQPSGQGFELIIVNAMWYSSLQEEGHIQSGRTYKIITQTWTKFKMEAGEFFTKMKVPPQQLKKMRMWYWTSNPKNNMGA